MARRKKGQIVNGWVNLYKPKDMGSTQAVSAVRRLFDAQKAGHAGTLDPLAEGILPIALGEATKTVPYVQDALKVYSFDLIWGESRSTDDAEGEVTEVSDIRPSHADLSTALNDFTGEIEQTPPIYSAIKINGERAYDLARKGEEVEMKTRQVYIESIGLLHHDKDKSSFEVTCGKGTYIRSLGRDIAKKLGSVGYIDNLKRLKVGYFYKKDAILLDKLKELGDKDACNEALLPVDTGLDDIPVLQLTDKEASELKQGRKLSFVSRGDVQRLETLSDTDIARAYCKDTLIGMVSIQGIQIQPLRMFNLNSI
ncbi:MAG: tRNA pseudouridine(55) synthase TruB [Micavibrio sp.]|nr:tRNA pseudouridine(55) synthase TruB [Micavibrio sp.]